MQASIFSYGKMSVSRLFVQSRSLSVRSALRPRRLLKFALGTTALTGVGFLSYTIYESGAEWEKFRRTSYFWSRMIPVYLRYRLQQVYFQLFPAKTPEEEDAAWLRLHNKYCDYVFNVVLHQRGVYIKLGQIASTRPDIIPKPYLKKFAQLQVSEPILSQYLYSRSLLLGWSTRSTWRVCQGND